MKISEIKKQSLIALKGKWGLAVLITFLFFLIYIVVPTIFEIPLSGGFDSWLDSDSESTYKADIFNIVYSFVLIPFYVSFYWFFLSLSRLETPKVSQLFTIYADWETSKRVFLTSILQGIFIFLWTLLLIIPGIIKSLAYSQYYFVLRDHPEYSITEAITESRKLMDGYKWKYFLLNLSFIGWSILAIITLGIGFLWLIPYITTCLAAFYDKVTEVQAQ